MKLPPSASARNEASQLFWAEQNRNFEKLRERQHVIEAAKILLTSEIERGIAPMHRIDIRTGMAIIASGGPPTFAEAGAIGGRAPRSCPLNDRLAEIVRRSPGLSASAVVRQLKQAMGDGLIMEVTPTTLLFYQRNEKEKIVSHAAIGHRLTRLHKGAADS